LVIDLISSAVHEQAGPGIALRTIVLFNQSII
jgi:hypothetical protein